MGSLKTRRRRNANLRFLAMMVGLLVVALAGGSMMKNSGSVTSLSDTQKSSSSSALFVYRRFLVEEEPEETKEEHKDKEEEKEGEDGEGEDGEDGEAEFEEEFELVDLRVVISIIVLLIVLTVAFEVGKETIEESVPEDYGVILEKFFGELTILGFLSMVTFLVSQFGVMAQVSELVYGEEEELQEKFELVHFALFFIMVGFVIQVLGMINEAEEQQEEWHKLDEKIIHEAEHHHTEDDHEVMDALHASKWYMLLCSRLWIGGEGVEKREAAVFKALRTEFILDRDIHPPYTPAPPERRVNDHFNFARYLGLAQIHILSHVVEVENRTWVFFALLAVLFYFIALLVDEMTMALAWTWSGFGWIVYLGNFFFTAHLLQLRNIFLPHIEVGVDPNEATPLNGARTNGAAEEGKKKGIPDHHVPKWTATNVDQLSSRTFVHRLVIGETAPNKQQAHYWMERQGPSFYTFLLQVNLLFLGIYAGVLILLFIPFVWQDKTMVGFCIYMLVALFPMIGVVYNKRDIVTFMAQVTSIGTYRKDQIIRDVLREQDTTRIVRTFIIIHRLRKIAESGLPASDNPNDHKLMRHSTFSELEVEEVGHSFDIFDTDKSGSISEDEFKELMRKLGADVEHMHFDSLIKSLDAKEDGEVDRDEFIAWYQFYSEKKDKHETMAEMAEEMFEMFNPHGHGELTIGELKREIDALNMGFKQEELAAILHELDKDRSGHVSAEEFEEFLEKFYPKELLRERH